ncbi:TPA: PilZ domain-containing protein [Klebsiella pneumoniae]|nr:PilZ domain-containing protein [Klebsiella pneumoniae]
MPERVYKKSRFEILAIFREDCRVKSILIINYQENKEQLKIKKVDGHYFTVEVNSFTPLQNINYNFILHSHLGKLEFSTHLFKAKADNHQAHICHFKIPDKIKISQRRIFPRILLNNHSNFFVYGHYDRGGSYKFTINDISEGGISFFTDNCQTDFIKKGQVLKHVEMTLGEYGSTVMSIKVVSVTDLHSEQFQGLKKLRVSCSFHCKSKENNKFLENVILQLTIDKKNKARRF